MSLIGLFTFFNCILFLAILGLLARFTFKVIVVQGKSMFPTLNTGDRIIVLSWWPKSRLLQGQIVVFQLQQINPLYLHKPMLETEEIYVKRITGLPESTITTSLNDIQVEQQFQFRQYHDEYGLRTWYIPSRHVFVRGDNRANSNDSVLIGPLSLDQIHGIVLMKLPWKFLLFSRRMG